MRDIRVFLILATAFKSRTPTLQILRTPYVFYRQYIPHVVNFRRCFYLRWRSVADTGFV